MVRNASDYIGSHVNSLLHELLAVRKRQDSLLRKCNDLDIHNVAHIVLKSQKRPQRREIRVGNVHMCTDVLNTMTDHFKNGCFGTFCNIIDT